MKDQLKLLEELQRHDARIQELEGARRAIPAKLESMRADLSRVEALVAREREELEQTERWRREKELEMKVEEQQLQKAKLKVGQAKKTNEAEAATREIEQTRKMMAETETRLLELVQAAEAAGKRLTDHEAEVEKLRQHVRAEEKASDEKVAGIDGEIGKLRGGRDAAAAAVRPDVLKKYNVIRGRRGVAVVPVSNGTCRGCNMNIPPQLFNQLQRGTTLEMCPNCTRIIYWDKLMEDPDGRPSDGGAAS